MSLKLLKSSWNDIVLKKKVLKEAGPFDQDRISNYTDIVNLVHQDTDSIQLTLDPDLSCCPHGHAYLPEGLIPTEFIKYTNYVEMKKTFDSHLQNKIQTISVDNEEMDVLMTQIKERVMEKSTSKMDFKRQRNFKDYGYAGDKCATQYKI